MDVRFRLDGSTHPLHACKRSSNGPVVFSSRLGHVVFWNSFQLPLVHSFHFLIVFIQKGHDYVICTYKKRIFPKSKFTIFKFTTKKSWFVKLRLPHWPLCSIHWSSLCCGFWWEQDPSEICCHASLGPKHFFWCRISFHRSKSIVYCLGQYPWNMFDTANELEAIATDNYQHQNFADVSWWGQWTFYQYPL